MCRSIYCLSNGCLCLFQFARLAIRRLFRRASSSRRARDDANNSRYGLTVEYSTFVNYRVKPKTCSDDAPPSGHKLTSAWNRVHTFFFTIAGDDMQSMLYTLSSWLHSSFPTVPHRKPAMVSGFVFILRRKWALPTSRAYDAGRYPV